MLVDVSITQEAKAMIEDLRMHHIDAQLIIKEDLDQTPTRIHRMPFKGYL